MRLKRVCCTTLRPTDVSIARAERDLALSAARTQRNKPNGSGAGNLALGGTSTAARLFCQFRLVGTLFRNVVYKRNVQYACCLLHRGNRVDS